MSTCPSDEQLRLWLDEGLDGAAEQDLADHLEACAGCQQALDRLTAVGAGVDATPDAVGRQPPGDTEPWRSALRVLGRQLLGDTQAEAVGRSAPAWPQVPGYEFLAELGKGGMGVVYKARQLSLNRVVAVKMILAGDQASPEQVVRFRVEAETAARLQHPNIVQVHEVGSCAGRPYLALEYLPGGSLADRLAGRPQPPRACAALVEVLARAMHHAHERGVVHRDLKPANILLRTEGKGLRTEEESLSPQSSVLSPVICDFGLARLLHTDLRLTATGVVAGTPSYMAPEQLRAGGAGVGPATDVYALGTILYECLTGRPPFRGEMPIEAVQQVLHQEPTPPSRLQAGLPRDLETVCLKCLAKEPHRRYASAAELADDLARFLRGEPVRARPVSALERAWKWGRRRPTLAALVLLALFVAGVGFPATTFLWLRADRARQQAEDERGQKERQRAMAEQARLLLEASVYADHIVLAQSAYQANDVPGALDWLRKCLPEPGRVDRRGWEWYYLRCLCRTDLLPGLQHGGDEWRYVHGVAFFPDGKRFVSGAGLPFAAYTRLGSATRNPGELKVWDATTGRCLATFTDHPGAVWAVAVSPDGRLLASGGADGSIHLRDGNTLALRPGPPREEGLVFCLSFSADGRLLAAGRGSAVLVWDLADPIRPKFRFATEGWAASTVALSPDGKRLAAGNVYGGPVRLWDLERGQEIAHRIPKGETRAVGFSPDGRWLALARKDDARIEIWDASGSRLHQQLAGHRDSVLGLAFTSAGGLASAGNDRTVRLWDAAGGQQRLVLRGHAAGVNCVAFDRAGKRLVSGDKVGGVRVWDVTRDPRGLLFRATAEGFSEWLGNLTFSADGRRLLALDGSPRRAQVGSWDAATGTLQGRRPLALELRGGLPNYRYVFSGDGGRLAGPDPADAKVIRVWNTDTGAAVTTIRTGRVTARLVALSGDTGKLAWVGWSAAGGILTAESGIADAATGRELRRLDLPPGRVLLHPTFSPDGRFLAAAALPVRAEGNVFVPAGAAEPRVWDTATGREALALEGGRAPEPSGMTFSPDGKRLALATLGGTLTVWNTADGRPCYPPLQASTNFGCPAFSPDGRRLAVAGRDGFVRLWDAATGNVLLTLQALGVPGGDHYGYVPRVAFSPDGTRLAANNWNGVVTIWYAAVPK
jgi:WD40 repeat protein